jgi:hypothetical protein
MRAGRPFRQFRHPGNLMVDALWTRSSIAAIVVGDFAS